MQRAAALLMAGLVLTVLFVTPSAAQQDNREEAAQLILDALPSLQNYDSYILEESRFIEGVVRIEDADGTLTATSENLQFDLITRVDASGESLRIEQFATRQRIDRTIVIETLSATVRLVDDVWYINTATTDFAWQQSPDNAVPAYDVIGINSDILAALHAGQSTVAGGIGTQMFSVFQAEDDILSRVDEVRLQDGRTADGESLTVIRLLGDALRDVVSDAVPLQPVDEATRQRIEAGVRDVSLLLVLDGEGRITSRVIAFNLVLQGLDPATLGLDGASYSAQLAVNMVEQYGTINDPVTITAPTLE